MATSIKDYINRALEVFNQGFAPYVESELKTHLGSAWEQILGQRFAGDKMFSDSLKSAPIHWDTSLLFSVMQSFWSDVFQKTIGPGERSLMFEIKDVRNDWAHQKNISFDNAYRALDSMERLLSAVARPEAEELNKRKQHILRQRYEAQSRQEVRKAAEVPLETQTIFAHAGVDEVPSANCAVLVAQALSVAISRPKPDGTIVRTMWGELAYQLGGPMGYAMVAEADAHGVSPGSDVLRELFVKFGPCLVLIDEWVVFVRQLYGKDENPPPAGSFDANLSFAQALTEAARATKNTLIVASLPASDIEVGGEGGKQALALLEHTFGRVQSPWRPANEEEGFEIVRRRLFQEITDPTDFVARDAVIRAFMEMYRSQSSEFPSECKEAEYERLMKNAYPIHPELFKRLYGDWGTLDKFQRTRGVLRLMAAVIHNLWERNDGALLITPASIPLDAANVKSELTQYLPQADAWTPIIERDVDGLNSLPLELDRANPTFGRYSASRRVARTLFIGSAPTLGSAHRGIEDNRIKLGCAQPKETISTFGDALRRLSDRATHLYLDGSRYWFATQPSVTRLAQDRAAQQNPDDIREEIVRRVKASTAAANSRGDFSKVHPCPASSGDVPDERDARLVVLAPEFAHTLRSKTSEAIDKCSEILNLRNSPRLYRNTLVFLAPDKTRSLELESAVRQYLAWKSIVEEEKSLNLDNFQSTQARKKEREADSCHDSVYRCFFDA